MINQNGHTGFVAASIIAVCGKVRGMAGWMTAYAWMVLATATGAEKNDWAEGTPGTANGATNKYYNAAGKLPWQNAMGDWRDAQDVAQGIAAYTSTTVADTDTARPVEWDVTRLVSEWIGGKYPNQGFFLRSVRKSGTIKFSSRESEQKAERPRLILEGDQGSITLEPQADTYLDKSTYRSLGNRDLLTVSNTSPSLLRFDLSSTERLGEISKATLRLYTTRQYGTTEIGVFRCRQGHDLPATDVEWGIAANYLWDKGITDHSDIIFATGFESENWHEEWTRAGKMDVVDTISNDADHAFESLRQRALRIRIAKGNTGALNTLFKFQNETGSEPEQIYFRYYLRLGDDWSQTVQGGKMPGISGTYGRAGWGGRKSNGRNGWSARGSFLRSIPKDNPLGGLHPIGTYCYHADMKGTYGDGWVWNRGYRGFLEKNRWYSIEQFLKLNTPGQQDGILRAWVDGRIAFEKSDIRFRHVDKLKIEQIWMNVYHGGTVPSPFDQHLFIDNVVIASQYIGPMKTGPTGERR